MSEKTILYLRTDISHEPLRAGGSVAHTRGVIQGFLDLGWRVVAASSIMQEQIQDMAVEECIILSNPTWLSWLRWRMNCILSNFFFCIPMMRAIKKYAPTYIYQRHGLLNSVGAVLSWWTRVPLILEYNGSEVWIDSNWGKRTYRIFTWLARISEHTNLSYAHTVVVVSSALRDELIVRGIDAQKIIVVPNGVDTNLYNPSRLCAERDAIRIDLNIESKCVFGFVGTFGPWHGIETILNMMIAMKDMHDDIHFIIIGDGPLKSAFDASIAEYDLSHMVTATGLLSHADARAYLAACDIFLCPTQPNKDGSPFFGSPTKLFEYMSLAKPVIASRIGQVADIVSSAGGILVDPHDTDGFVHAACTLMHDVSLRKQLGDDARNQACAHHTWLAHVETIINHR